jgi:spermidine/putrescine-binding protein
VDSWATFQDAKYHGKMTMMDDGREVIGAFLRYRGHSLNSTDPQQLARSKADAIQAKKHLKAYISAPVKAQLISGDVWIAQLWNGDTTQAKAEQPNLAYAIPKEGCTIWGDSMCVPRSAPNKRAAHEWMNYILRPDVGAALSNATGYGTPNAPAAKMLDTPVPYPSEEELKRLEYQVDLGRDTATWDQIWTEIKSA